jgi:hypothetical protein
MERSQHVMDRDADADLMQRETSAEISGSGGIVEGVGGAGAVVLSILALIGVLPMELLSVAAIGIGGGLLVGGGTIAARYSRFLMAQRQYTRDVIAGGMVMESVCGVAGIALGILSLLGILPMTLLSTAAIVFGGALLMASGAMARMNSLPIRGTAEFRESHAVARDVLYAASGSEVLIGLAAMTLGILALVGIRPMSLVAIALLSCGASILFSGTSIAGRMFGLFH